MPLKEYLIGGLPADLWVGRRTKCTGKDSTRHPFRCKIRSMDGPKITIVPDGHRNTDVVDISDIVPWWSPNSDLKFLLEKQMKQSNSAEVPEAKKQATLELDLSMPREEILKDVTPAPLPPVVPVVSYPVVSYTPAEVPTALHATQPQLLIRSHTQDWIPVYQKYLALLHEESGTLDMRKELDALLTSCRQAQQEALKELEQLGVEMLRPENTKQAIERRGSKRGVAKKGAAHTKINTWAEAVQARLHRNAATVISGSVTGMAARAKLSVTTFRNNMERMSVTYGLRFTGDNNSSGRAARGTIRVTLA